MTLADLAPRRTGAVEPRDPQGVLTNP
jgi:hypothetical protein